MKNPSGLSCKVLFFQIQSSQHKLKKILSTCQEHFDSTLPLLIYTPNEESNTYIDDLLWKEPQNSFLPHSIYPSKTSNCISLSTTLPEKSPFHYIFNLTKHPIDPHKHQLHKIYEFEDVSSNDKQADFKQKLSFYQNCDCRVISL